MLPIRDNSKRADIALKFMIVFLAVIFLELFAGIWQLILISGFENGTVTTETLQLSDKVVQVISILYLLLDLATIISFIMWFRRAYWNLHQVNPMATFFSEGWAAGAWFVPFVNLGRPYRIMREIWMGTLMVFSGNTDIVFPKSALRAWWTFWLLYNIIASISFQVSKHSTDISGFKTVGIINIVCRVCGITSLLILIILVRQFSKVESKLGEAIQLPSDSVFSVQIPNYNNESGNS